MSFTYAEHAAWVAAITSDVDRVTYRLKQGAISHEGAAARLRDIADAIEAGMPEPARPVEDEPALHDHGVVAPDVVPSSTWHAELTHPHGCQACEAAIAKAVDLARCTGSTGSTYTDGPHVARVARLS